MRAVEATRKHLSETARQQERRIDQRMCMEQRRHDDRRPLARNDARDIEAVDLLERDQTALRHGLVPGTPPAHLRHVADYVAVKNPHALRNTGGTPVYAMCATSSPLMCAGSNSVE